MYPQYVSPDEIADIIFNSPDAELNDSLMRIISSRRYNVAKLFIEMTMRINDALPFTLRLLDDTQRCARREFLREKITIDLTYYAIRSEFQSEHRL